MDYLDPRKRKAYTFRLILGYVLVAIVIGLGTVIIVYGANGYGINTKTGQIVQNALLFTDSKPGGAEIYLNGQDRNATTAARLVLPAGKYTLTLKKDGYRDWTRQFTLYEQSVARYVYPFLFPKKPLITSLQTYTAQPALFTESPDRHWLLVENMAASSQVPVFDEYDLTTLDKQSPSIQQVSIPSGLLSNYSSDSKLEVTEWSTDNNNVLLKHTYTGGSEYIVFNRVHPDQSFNVNKMFGSSPQAVSLYNKRTSQLYLLGQDGSLRLGDTSSQTLAPATAKGVLAFKPYGKDLVTYVSLKNGDASTAVASIWSGGKVYELSEFSAGSNYLIDAAQFNGHFYYAAGSDTSGFIKIYKDPIDYINNPVYARAQPLIGLHDPGAQKVGFSDNARFVGAENSQQFSVYDFETANLYQYSAQDPLAGNLDWMDGHRYIGESGGNIMVMDYDGTNAQLLSATSDPEGGLFSTDYNHLLTVAPSVDGHGFVLQDIDMRAGTDLPKNKQNAS